MSAGDSRLRGSWRRCGYSARVLLYVTLVLLAQTPTAVTPPPASPAPTVRVSALAAAGVPAHVVDFCQEHLYAELQREGFAVLRADATPADTAAARAAVTGEMVLFPSGFRVTVRAHRTDDGRLLAEHVAQQVPEQRLLETLTEAVAALAPSLRVQLTPAAPEPLAPAPTLSEQRPLRRWAWVPLAGGALFLGTGTAFLLQARSHDNTLNQPGPVTPPVDGEAVASSGQRAQTLSRVSFALGGAGVLAGAALYFLPVERLWGSTKASSLQLHVGPGGVGVSGVLP